MRYDTPPPSWYEPPDLDDDEDLVDRRHPELLTVAAGLVWWSAAPIDADD